MWSVSGMLVAGENRNNLPHWHFVLDRFIGLESVTGLLGERLAINRLNHGTDHLFVYFISVLVC